MPSDSDTSDTTSAIVLDRPKTEDGGAVWRLIRRCPPLDVNTCYAYLLVCHHFAATSVVARRGAEIVGFISAYRPPEQDDVVFVWQVAVDDSARGEGLGGRMLAEILERPACRGVRWLETTISPSNKPSQKLFESLARKRGAEVETRPLFTAEMFGGDEHEEEVLYRIGPLA